jgi:hypothetical protein
MAAGAAIGTRYFMVALVPSLLVATWLLTRGTRRERTKRVLVAMAAVVGGFALTTPYFFLNFGTAFKDVLAEADEPNSDPPEGLNHPQTFLWYVFVALPQSIGWIPYGLAVAGAVIAARRRYLAALLVAGVVPVFLLGLSLSDIHRARWTIQTFPILNLLAASAAIMGLRWLVSVTTRLRRPAQARLSSS